jgi:hypothetical protein
MLLDDVRRGDALDHYHLQGQALVVIVVYFGEPFRVRALYGSAAREFAKWRKIRWDHPVAPKMSEAERLNSQLQRMLQR